MSLRNIIDGFKDVRVLVVGDSMMDRYHFGRIDRLSPEAPVPVFIEERQKGRPGGAANVAANVEALGANLDSVFGRPSIKTRYMVGHHQVFRIDQDTFATEDDVSDAMERLVEPLQRCNVVILSDYAKGLLTKEFCRQVIAGGKPVIVDPKGRDWEKYQGAAVICPNSKELDCVIGLGGSTWNIIEKRGPLGLMIHRNPPPHSTIEATCKKVFDVTGAGDTVVATLACAMGAGASLYDAAVLANHAAGVVVGKIGTDVCKLEELLACV